MGCLRPRGAGGPNPPALPPRPLPSNHDHLGTYHLLGTLPHPPLPPHFAPEPRRYRGGQTWERGGSLLVIGACSLSPSPQASFESLSAGWGKHGLASSRGSALGLSRWARQQGQRLRRGSQWKAVETRLSGRDRVGSPAGGSPCTAETGRDQTCFQGRRDAQGARAVWDRCQSG